MPFPRKNSNLLRGKFHDRTTKLFFKSGNPLKRIMWIIWICNTEKIIDARSERLGILNHLPLQRLWTFLLTHSIITDRSTIIIDRPFLSQDENRSGNHDIAEKCKIESARIMMRKSCKKMLVIRTGIMSKPISFCRLLDHTIKSLDIFRRRWDLPNFDTATHSETNIIATFFTHVCKYGIEWKCEIDHTRIWKDKTPIMTVFSERTVSIKWLDLKKNNSFFSKKENE